MLKRISKALQTSDIGDRMSVEEGKRLDHGERRYIKKIIIQE